MMRVIRISIGMVRHEVADVFVMLLPLGRDAITHGAARGILPGRAS